VAGMEPKGRSVAEAAGEETVVAKAQARVIAVAEAASALRSRIESIDSELDRLLETLRSAAAGLAEELGAIERDMGALYEAAGMGRAATPEAPQKETPAADLEGARLTALNMALNGDSRKATARYLAEHFGLSEPDRLIDEVYAAVER
jgi:hypothetical protein